MMYHTNEPTPTIVFEDVSPKGWVTADDHMGFDLTTTKLIIQRLAQFHATSIYMDRGVIFILFNFLKILKFIP